MRQLRRVVLSLVVALAILGLAGTVTVFAQDGVTLTILHINDMHGRLEPFTPSGAKEDVGGLVRVATLVNQIRAEAGGEGVILLNAGDAVHGTNVTNLFNGEPVIDAMNAMGFKALTLGNHEFNFGQDVLANLQAKAQFPFLAANVYKETEPGHFTGLTPLYVIYEVKGIKVGIFGLSPKDTPIVTHPNNVIGLTFEDPVATAKAVVADLEGKADVIIALSHLGYSEDIALAKAVPGIDVIVGGHSHTEVPTPVKEGKTIIVQAGEYAKFLGRLDITVKDGDVVSYNGSLIPVANKVASDPTVADIIAKYNSELNTKLKAKAGSTAVNLDGERANVRTKETNLGNFVCDVLKANTGADIALTNGGNIRASINAGDITVGDVYTVLPFDNIIMVLEVTGAQLKAALEQSVSKYPEQLGGFMQVSGLKFTFGPSRPAGERVVEVLVNGKPLDLAAKYSVATNDFIAAGGDGYTMFKDAKVLVNTGLMFRDIVVEYLQGLGQPISPEVEGRIIVKQ